MTPGVGGPAAWAVSVIPHYARWHRAHCPYRATRPCESQGDKKLLVSPRTNFQKIGRLGPRVGERKFSSAEVCLFSSVSPDLLLIAESRVFKRRSLCSQSRLHPTTGQIGLFGRRFQAISEVSSRGIGEQTTCTRCDP